VAARVRPACFTPEWLALLRFVSGVHHSGHRAMT
jgi:hypothetical protein